MLQDAPVISAFFFFNDTATTEIYTLSLHDALPICPQRVDVLSARRRRLEALVLQQVRPVDRDRQVLQHPAGDGDDIEDRKSTRLNSSHANISYAVFCLKKKKNTVHNCT